MSGRPPGRVRIVGGSARGRRIDVPSGGVVRPTSDKVREAVFNVLGSVAGLHVLDLFAGTGALGLEALSRGAEMCVFVESDVNVGSILKKNCVMLGYEAVATVLISDYQTAMENLQRSAERFDLLFLDPPYRMLAEVGASLSSMVSGVLSSQGVAVIEGPRSLTVTLGQDPVFERDYGDTKITMVRVKE